MIHRPVDHSEERHIIFLRNLCERSSSRYKGLESLGLGNLRTQVVFLLLIMVSAHPTPGTRKVKIQNHMGKCNEEIYLKYIVP